MDGSPPVRPRGARSPLWAQKDMVHTQQGRAPAGDNTQCAPRKSLTPPILVPSTSPAQPGTTSTTAGPSELLHRCEVQLRSRPRRGETPSVWQPASLRPAPGTLDRTHLAERAADLGCFGAEHDGCEPRAFRPPPQQVDSGRVGVMVGKPSQQPQKALCFYPVALCFPI